MKHAKDNYSFQHTFSCVAGVISDSSGKRKNLLVSSRSYYRVEGCANIDADLLKSEDNKRSTDDFMVVLFLVFGLWHFFSTRVVLLSKLLFPEPDAVLGMLFSDFFELVTFHLVHSVILLLSGYVLALAVAIPLGIIIATHGRFLRLADPYIKLLGPIPPLVYIPYLIATLPTFYSASVAVISLRRSGQYLLTPFMAC